MIRTSHILAGALLLISTTAQAAYTCRSVDVLAGEEGVQLKGIEDLVYHPPSRSLILSAHDRWGDMDGDPDALNGLFRISADDLVQGGQVRARDARTHASTRPAMKPHGLALRQFRDGTWHLLAINHHTLQQETTELGAPGTTIEHFVLDGEGNLAERRVPAGQPELCPANDLDWVDDRRAIVSLDRQNCGGVWRFLELSLAQHRGKLARLDMDSDGAPQLLAEDLGFPNGVLVRGTDVFVAYSREQRLARYELQGWNLIEKASYDLPGGGDNLAIDSQGRLLLAVHPDLMDFGLYSLRVWGWDSAPTRLMRFTADGAVSEVLYDDPTGAVMSGVTSIVEVDGRLIGGAAFDKGLIVCDPPQ